MPSPARTRRYMRVGSEGRAHIITFSQAKKRVEESRQLPADWRKNRRTRGEAVCYHRLLQGGGDALRAVGNGLFHFVMIKPSHYDDDGYPIQWFRSAIPSNTLACLNALAEDARGRNVLGPDVEIRLHTYDETNRRVRPDRIIREIRKAGGKALIGLVGVQSNQFPRAVDLARPFLAAGLPVCIGGFHISGCIAMLPEMPQDMREAQELGISFFAGEGEEGRFDEVLRDAC